MSIKLFTKKEITLLSNNPYIKTVSIKAITYSNEFKRIFIVESEKGKTSRVIFEEHGFDVSILGMSRVRQARNRWKASYKSKGILGLDDARKGNSGRSSDK